MPATQEPEPGRLAAFGGELAAVPLPGPADRESFLDAQRRNRRAGWWFTGWSAASVALTGIPLSALVSPVLCVLAVVVLDVVNLAVPAPDLAGWLGRQGDWTTLPLDAAIVRVALPALLVPGALLLVAAWLGVRRALSQARAAGSVAALGARPPRPGDPEERQVANVVAELALAAGIPPPAVLVLDDAAPNAVAVGTSFDDAAVVVTTGLLAGLDRAATQGVLAHVVAGVGNGDLRTGLTLASVFQAIGLPGTVLAAPADAEARRLLWRLVRAAFRPGRAGDAALADDLLRAGVLAPGSRAPGTVRGLLLWLPLLPLSWAYRSVASGWGYLVAQPFLGRAWRSRRYRADAAAVGLTRDPDALARGLALLAPVRGAEWTGHLFAGGAVAADDAEAAMWAYQPPLRERVARLRAMGAAVPPAAAGEEARTHPLVNLVLVPFVAFAMLVPLALAFLGTVVLGLAVGPPVAWLHDVLRAAASP